MSFLSQRMKMSWTLDSKLIHFKFTNYLKTNHGLYDHEEILAATKYSLANEVHTDYLH